MAIRSKAPLLKLSGKLIRPKLLLNVSGDYCLEYKPDMRPWDSDYVHRNTVAHRLDLIGAEPENEDYATFEPSGVPEIKEPDWKLENCVTQWQMWRRAHYLRDWINAETPTAKASSQCAAGAYDKLIGNVPKSRWV